MNDIISVLVGLGLLLLVAGCASTEYKQYEGTGNVFEGVGGTKVTVDGMDIWDNGEPPRKFKVIGIIDDERRGAISIAMLRSDMVKKAKEAGGDALILLGSDSRIAGYYTTGSAAATTYGSTATAMGTAVTVPIRRGASKFAVVKFLP